MEIHYKLTLLLFILFSIGLNGQDSTHYKQHRLGFQTQFFQVKEGANYGLVFNGLNLVIAYDFVTEANKRLTTYSADLAFGVNFNKGTGLNWHFKPVDFFYGFEIVNKTQQKLHLGPYVAANYQWQIYPELQSGHMFWFSIIDIGPKAVYRMPIGNKNFKISLSNSIAGFASRPVPSTETHFYSFQFSDFLTNAHKNLEFGSFDLFNHTNFEFEWLKVNKKRLSIAYEFEYFGYYKDPKLSYLTHAINLYWKLGKHKKVK